MKKHVYQFNKYINKQGLVSEILPLISDKSILSMSNKIIDYLSIDRKSLENEQISIQLIDQKKDLKQYLSYLLLEQNNEDEVKKVIERLENIGIRQTNVDLKELSSLINVILINDVMLNQIVNLKKYSYDSVQAVLEQYKLFPSESVLRNFVDLLNQLSLVNKSENMSNCQPIRRTKYYDENNNIVLKVVMEKDSSIPSSLTEFEGEIYDSLSFKNYAEALRYQEENGIEEDLLEDVVSVLHFHCESTHDYWYNDLSIIKYSMGCIYINYGERLFVQNKKNRCSITPEEVEAIIMEFDNRGIDNEFIRYVVHELKQFKATLLGKDDRMTVEKMSELEQQRISYNEIIRRRDNSLSLAKKILDDEEYGNDKTIYVKIKVISDTPITFEKSKQKRIEED